MTIFDGSLVRAGVAREPASGHVATLPPSRAIKSRRFIQHLRPSAKPRPSHGGPEPLPHLISAAKKPQFVACTGASGREKAGGHYATGLLLQLPARVRFHCDSMTQSLRGLG